MHHRVIFAVCAVFLFIPFISQAQTVRPIIFPVQGGGKYIDDFHDARSGHLHEGNDIVAPKMTPVLAVVDGKIGWLTETEASWGWEITLQDADGYEYNYIHLNNDTPGTDDGSGGRANAFAPEVVRGARVTKGQIIGWVGDSGNAENISSHLHFEIREPGGAAINPYESLRAAEGKSAGAAKVSVKAKTVSYTFKNRLVVGSTGVEVRELQKRLAAEGVYTGPITGYYGPLTQKAVKKYQALRKLQTVGIVGPATRAALNA